MNNTFLRKLIGSILMEAQEISPKGITITTLVKFVYLADLYNAEHVGQGQTLTDTNWIFYKFGPYSYALRDEIDSLVAANILLSNEVEDRELSLLQLNSARREDQLDKLGLPFYVVSNLKNKIKKYCFDLSGLLDYVYFDTTPMENVTPGQELSFLNCVKIPVSAYKPIQLKEPSEKVKKRLRELSSKMEVSFLNETKSFMFSTPPLYDQEFYKAIEGKHGSDNDTNIIMDATLSFDK